MRIDCQCGIHVYDINKRKTSSKMKFYIYIPIILIMKLIEASMVKNEYFRSRCELDSGILNDECIYRSYIVRSFVECVSYCTSDDECTSVNVYEKDGAVICRLYTLNLDLDECHDLMRNDTCRLMIKTSIENEGDTNSETEYIFKNDENGNALIGSADHLIQNAKNASRIKILVDENTEGFIELTDTTFSLPKSTVYCAMSVYNFQYMNSSDLYHRITFFCSDGKVHVQDWRVGVNVKVSDTVTHRSLTWFVRYIATETIRTSQSVGDSVNGANDNLIEAISNGYEGYVYIQSSYTVKLDSMSVQSDVMYGQVLGELSLSGSSLRYSLYWYFLMFNSADFNRHVIRTFLYGTTELADTFGAITDMAWQIDTKWKLVFETDFHGNCIYGSYFYLLKKIRNGHRVRIAIENEYQETYLLWIYDSSIWTMTMQSLSNNGNRFQRLPVYRKIKIACSNGFVQSYEINFQSGELNFRETKNTTLRWFVDDREWSAVFENGAFLNGFNELSLVNDGHEMRCIVSEANLTMAIGIDTMRYNVADGSIKFGSFRHLDVFNGMMHHVEFGLTLPPEFLYFYLHDNGSLVTLKWAYGESMQKDIKFSLPGSKCFAAR